MNPRWLAYACALLVPIVLGYACKSESGGTFIEITQMAPENDQTEVPVEARIGFRINAPINRDTLTSETVFLTDDDGAVVPSTVAVGDEPNIAELTLDEPPLDVITTFTVTVTTGLRSSGGATLEEDFEWTFRTLDSAWGVSDWLETIATGSSADHETAIDKQSNALTVWQYSEPSGIWAARYTRTDLWGEPELIDGGGGGSRFPKLAVDGPGNGFAVWEQRGDGFDTRVFTNRYDLEDGWGVAEPLQSGEITPARLASVAADPTGNAIAVWVQQDMDTFEEVVWARRYEPDTNWGVAAPIDQLPPTSFLAGGAMDVGMDDQGNAVAVWTRPAIAGGDVIWANRYEAGLGWGAAGLIKTDDLSDARNVRLDVGASGDAFVTWAQDDGVRQDIYSVRFSGSSWVLPPKRIDNFDDNDKSGPDIAVDGNGVAHAVWSQADADFDNIWANQYTPGSGWGTPELIEEPPSDPLLDDDAENPRVDVNTDGNAFVVWNQRWEGWISVWSNRLDPDTGWMTAERIEEDPRSTRLPKVIVDENRHAHGVWLHSVDQGVDWVRTNRFE